MHPRPPPCSQGVRRAAGAAAWLASQLLTALCMALMLPAGLAGWAALALGRALADAARGACAAIMWLAAGGQPDAMGGWAPGAGADARARRGAGWGLRRLLVPLLAAWLLAFACTRGRPGALCRMAASSAGAHR